MVFYLTKFCDSEQAEWPYLRDRLAARGYPGGHDRGRAPQSGLRAGAHPARGLPRAARGATSRRRGGRLSPTRPAQQGTGRTDDELGARLEATNSLKDLIKGYYDELFAAAAEGRPSAWLNVGVPCEFFYAMDIFPFYPENYGAACGAMKLTPKLSAVAEARGFSADLCSYVRATLGSVFSGEGPYGPPPASRPSRWTP